LHACHTSLCRFEVIDGNNLRKMLEEHALQQTGVIADSMLVNIGQIAAAKEALMVNVLNFSQFLDLILKYIKTNGDV